MTSKEATYLDTETTLPIGQQHARTRWRTHASGEAFDRKKKPYLTEQAQEFIAQQAFCVIAGLDIENQLGGLLAMETPGFVQTPDTEVCLLRLSKSHEISRIVQRLQQVEEITQLGLFFICHPTRERLCVQGTAELLFADPPGFSYFTDPPASLWVLLHVRQAFFHCVKYIKTRVAGLTVSEETALPQLWQSERLLNSNFTCLSSEICAFIAQQVLCYLCTVDQAGQCAVNHRGGAPGFLVTLPPDDASPGGTILLPDYAGNGAFEAIGNILETERATLIIPNFSAQLALSITGRAHVLELDDLPALQAKNCLGAERVVALSVQRIELQTGDWSTSLAYERARAASGSEMSMPVDACRVSPIIS